MAKTTIRDLDLKIGDLKNYFNNELCKFRSEIETVKTPTGGDTDGAVNVSVGDVIHRFDFFKATVENKLAELESQIRIFRKEVDTVNARLDNHIQRTNRSKLLVKGCKETPGEDLLDTIVKIINSKLQLAVRDIDIYNCYRFGKKSDNRARPVLVEFYNLRKRDEVLKNKKQFKGTGVLICEVLSPLRYDVYRLAKQRYDKNCWTNKGRIGFKVGDSVKYVSSISQLNSATESSADIATASVTR